MVGDITLSAYVKQDRCHHMPYHLWTGCRLIIRKMWLISVDKLPPLVVFHFSATWSVFSLGTRLMYDTGICIVHYVAQIRGNELMWAPYSFAVLVMLFAVCSSHLATVSMIRGRLRLEMSIHTSLEAPGWVVEYLVKGNVECEVFHTFREMES